MGVLKDVTTAAKGIVYLQLVWVLGYNVAHTVTQSHALQHMQPPFELYYYSAQVISVY